MYRTIRNCREILRLELGAGPLLEDVCIAVRYDCIPEVPAQVIGPVEACYPAQAAEVHVHSASAALGPGLGAELNPVDLSWLVEGSEEARGELSAAAADYDRF